jgi:DNA-binding NarL/FixJ family response regulator
MIEERPRIGVFLADDHPLILDGVRALIETTCDLDVVGTASNGTRALSMIRDLEPAIAVLDICMPDSNGIEVAQALGERSPTRVIMLSVSEDRNCVQRAAEAGARGYVLKRSIADNLLFAIRSVSRGGFYIDPMIAGRMVPSMGFGVGCSKHRPGVSMALTERETEVLKLVAMGYTLKEVAVQLSITMKSVETYKARASEKLDLGSRAKIVRFAVLQGWFQDMRV